MSFEFSVFHEFPRYAGVTDAEAFTQSFAQVDAAERWGLDVIWIAELHFLPERSVASAPLLIASAIASQTRRMRIGIAVQVLPLCHPLRLAEEVATLDQAMDASFSVWAAAAFPAPTRPMAYLTARAASASPKCSKSSSAVGLRSASPLRESFTGFTMSQLSRSRCRGHIRRCASQRQAQIPIRRLAPWACQSSLPSASVHSKNWVPA